MSTQYQVMDGNTAAAYTSYAFTEVSAMFPITPSSVMAELTDEWATQGKKNIFGTTVDIIQLQSEGGAAGAVHGSLSAGALTTTYTASQGLLLMIPNIYKVAGELKPGVFHVSARTVSAHALSIFGDHSDVMACRQTGAAMMASANPQEVMDLGAISHLSAIKGSMAFIHFFDGFRTSHEMQKIAVTDYDEMAKLVDYEALEKFRKGSLNPERPLTRGTTQNPDIFFQQKEASNRYFDELPGIVSDYMKKFGDVTGRYYDLFDYYGAEDAEYLIVIMGSGADTVKETVDYMTAQGLKVGMINVHLYRPFSLEHFLDKVPATVKRIAAMDRCKEAGSVGEPLYKDICNVYYEKGIPMEIVGGRYGVGQKDTTPAQFVAVYENLMSDEPKNDFTIGIEDDLTFKSLPMKEEISTSSPGTIECKLWGIGSDGTIGAGKNTTKIVGKHTDKYVQAFFVYDSKKSGGMTQTHLRFSDDPIRSPYLVTKADYVACSVPAYLNIYDMTKHLKDGGIFLLNCMWKGEELEANLPAAMKRDIASRGIKLYVIDAIHAALDIGLGNRTNTILQSSFFYLTGVMPAEEAMEYMKDAIRTTYIKKGEDVIAKNISAIERGITDLVKVDVPESWKDCPVEEKEIDAPDYIKNVVMPMNAQEGDSLPVSAFKDMADGSFPNGSTEYEKRGTAVTVPCWEIDECIQCNRCAYVCPHAAIRPFLLDEKEMAEVPEGFETVQAKGPGLEKYQFRMQLSPLDCTGCGSCVENCPKKGVALHMEPLPDMMGEADKWTFAFDKVMVKEEIDKKASVKNSQFAQPLFEFSAACAGCAETPYIKLLTQLFGRSMFIANASGCSSAFGGSTPGTPYRKDKFGCGPTWAMSLFEDCAEYAYGMMLGSEKIRKTLKAQVEELAGLGVCRAECEDWLENMENREASIDTTAKLVAALGGAPAGTEVEEVKINPALSGRAAELATEIVKNKEYLAKKSYWAFGGDGWAYDIGYGGLDHVIASGRDINILVLDTEVYSNTGGQSSKATPTGAIAKFAAGGKETKKKDLGMMAMSYGYVYVAQVAMGADQNQTLKAFREAEAYPGPSIVICYCPCIEHGIKVGMTYSQIHQKDAVDCGYWNLYRYNPLLAKEGKNPFTLDSKEPTANLREFLMSENRYTALKLIDEDRAEQFYQKAQKDCTERYEKYRALAEG